MCSSDLDGSVAEREIKIAKAIADFEQALRIDPEFRDACYNLAVTLFETRGAREAVACLDSALAKWTGAADFEQLRTALMAANAKA